jgi:hypothetical protein
MSLFGRGDKDGSQATDQAIAQAEVDRLVALSPVELAVELLAAFGPDGARSKGKTGVAPMQIIEWLIRSVGRSAGTKPLVPALLASLQALQSAGLVVAAGSGLGTGASTYQLTPFGERVVADGTAAEHLILAR